MTDITICPVCLTGFKLHASNEKAKVKNKAKCFTLATLLKFEYPAILSDRLENSLSEILDWTAMFDSENWAEVLFFVDYFLDLRPSMSQTMQL